MQKSLFFILICLAAPSGPIALAQSAPADEIAELRKQVEALTGKVNDLEQKLNKARLDQPVFGTGASSASARAVVSPDTASSEYVPPKETNLAAFNPEVSAAFDAIGSYSRRADNVNFIVRDAEIMIQANVDHLAHAYAVFNAETELTPLEKTDAFEDISVGLEEAAIETTDLPWGLKVKAGQFFADFTRLGKVHSHELPFTDRPPSLDRIVGGEAKARGVELTWIPPINHYARFTAGAVDNIGAESTITSQLRRLDGEEEDAFAFRSSDRRSWSDVLYYGRAATIFELGSQAQLNVGGNYARGRDAGTRQLASGDFKLSWRPRPDSYDLFELSGEYLWGRSHGAFADDALFDFGPTGGIARAHGGYVYAQYRFGKQWQPGVRFDYLHADEWEQGDLDLDGGPDFLKRGSETLKTYSAYLTYYFSEFNRLHLQMNYVRGDRDILPGGKDDWQAFLQWSITIGPHKHPFSP
jgi:hypothetical protein